MEIKRNEATLNRPEGDRVIDAPYVFIDIPDFIAQIKDEKAWDKNDRNGITVFKSESLTVVLTALKAGAEIKDNEVDGYLTLQILKGEGRIITPDGDATMGENQQIVFHPNLVHSLQAISDIIVLLTTYKKD